MNSRCWHLECLKNNTAYMQRVKDIVEFGFSEDRGFYFGEMM